MKGARQLCGMYDTSPSNMKRPCISCDCDNQNLDNENFICKPVLEKNMKDIILDSDTQLTALQSISQHRNEYNAFFNINLGGWKYGIWGLCPSELLHQFYEGVVGYLLEEFSEGTLNDRYQVGLSIGVDMIVKACRNLGCSSRYPSGTFTMGITKFNKLKGVEKFGCMFYLCLFLHTDLAKTKFFEGVEKAPQEMETSINDWKKLFESCLYYHDWVMQKSFDKITFPRIKKAIKELHRSIKALLQRNTKGIKHIPKIHEFFHVTRNILWHGPMIGYDTRAPESNLRIHKRLSQNTQRQLSTFNQQTAMRLFENTLINQSVSHVESFATKMFCNYSSTKTNESTIAAATVCESPSTRRNVFYAIYDNEKDIVEFFLDKSGKKPIINTIQFDNEIKSFLKNRVFSLLTDPSRQTCVECLSCIVRKGISFRGYSTEKTKFPGWAMLQWVTKTSNSRTLCPAKILFFMNLFGLKFKDEFRNQYQINCYYAVIQSLRRTPTEINHGTHKPICAEGYFENVTYKYHIVSERIFVDSCFVIPNFGHPSHDPSNNLRVLYVFPRCYYTSPMAQMYNNGWSSKF